MTNKTKQEAMYEMQHGTHIRICLYLYFIWKSAGNGGKHSLHVFENMFYIHHVRASLVAQMAKNLSAVWETWVPSLGWDDLSREGTGNPLQYSCLENPMDIWAWQATGYIVHGAVEWNMTEQLTYTNSMSFNLSWNWLADLFSSFHWWNVWCRTAKDSV